MATTKATLLGHRSATSFSDLTLSGDLTVNGTTTTLDTAVQNVDKLEIGASSTDYGAKINQASTGNILQLQDNGTDVMVVKDGGNVGIGTTSATSVLTVKSDTANDLANGIRFEGHDSTNTPVLIYENGTGEGVLELFDDSTKKIRFRTRGDSYFNGGKVGIGTTSPGMPLHVYSAENNLMHLQSTDQDALFKLSDSGGHFQINTANNNTSLGTNGRGEMLRFAGTGAIVINEDGLDQDFRVETDNVSDALFVQGTSGKVGMGTTSPLGQLDIRGPSGSSSWNNIHLTYTPTGADTDSWYMRTGGNARFYIDNRSTGNGAYIQYNTSGWSSVSDRRWKTDWTPITGSLEKLLNIEVAKYHLLVGDDLSNLKKAKVKEGFNETWNVGVSAQDCLEAGLEDVVDCPVLDGSGDETSQKGINYNQLTAICVQAIQELSAKVTTLENATN